MTYDEVTFQWSHEKKITNQKDPSKIQAKLMIHQSYKIKAMVNFFVNLFLRAVTLKI